MYISRISIDNYGCIEHFDYTFRYNKKSNPVPLVLIGKNGTGKTLVLANIIDALVELKRQCFQNLLEVSDAKYFKIGSKNYIRRGAEYSRVAISFENNSSPLTMHDIMSNAPQLHIDNNIIQLEEIANKSEFLEDGFSRKITGTHKKTDYSDFIQLYFPADRYYQPLWYNDANYKKVNYDGSSDIHSAKSNIIKIDLLSNIKEWLIDVWMSQTVQIIPIVNDERIPAELRGKTVQIPQNTPLQSIINQLFTIIKGIPCQAQRPNRKIKMIGIAGAESNCYDISQLSAGEMFLYGIGLSILKEWDINHEVNNTEEIRGTVIIDEADANLHIDFMYCSLPKLMQMFPNIQFIITTHSPFLLAGLKQKYGQDIDIVNMPYGNIVATIEDFSEMSRAFEIFDAEAALVYQRSSLLSIEYEKLKTLSNKIFIVTEGKTDIKHIKNAFSRLYSDDDEIIKRIQYFNFDNSETLGDELKKALRGWAKIPNSCKIIALIDRDKEIVFSGDNEYTCLGNNVYLCNIPFIENAERAKDDRISIEHYYSNAELSLDIGCGHLYLWHDFDKYGTSYDKCWSIKNYTKNNNSNPLRIIDKNDRNLEQKSDDAKIISKDEFANYVIAHPEKYNVDNFAQIYNLIKRIVDETSLA